jgi:cbb3-type cytochrome oxidase subunit 1
MPFYWLRFIGGTLYLAGTVLMAVNFWKTVSGAPPHDGRADENAPVPVAA